MGKKTGIAWCNHTFNPWIGCTKVSDGCKYCYAEALNTRFGGDNHYGKGIPRKRTSEKNWRQPVIWNNNARNMWTCSCGKFMENYCTPPDKCPVCGGSPNRLRPRVFCGSLGDWLDDEVPVAWLADLLALIHDTPELDWLLLTKRPENWRKRIMDADEYLCERPSKGIDTSEQWSPYGTMGDGWLCGKPPPNVWIGVTVENQENALWRVPNLLEIPAVCRFLSCEPLLGKLDLWSMNNNSDITRVTNSPYGWWENGLDWVICGGESGDYARPMNPIWARHLCCQCETAKIPFFFKQWGEWLPHGKMKEGDYPTVIGTGPIRLEPEGRYGNIWMDRVGKKNSGYLLDGVQHRFFPRLTR